MAEDRYAHRWLRRARQEALSPLPPLDEAELDRITGELGFDVWGVAQADALPLTERRLRAAARRGDLAGMEWLARDPTVRTDPRRLLEGCASVIMVGQLHAGYRAAEPGRPRVAAYATGRDYHNLLLRKLKKLARRLHPDRSGARFFVDTGPMMEKVWAERAGIGWQGRHTHLVHQRLGNRLMLGCLLSTRPPPRPDRPHPDRCGSCTRCVDICPTAALARDARRLDARRCISWLTIENRGPIPRSLRRAIGGWLFGCDLCVSICPWNRWAVEARELRLVEPHPVHRALTLERLLSWDEEAFDQATLGTPLRRPKRVGLARNAAVVAANLGRVDLVPLLVERVGCEPSALVRGHLYWALGVFALAGNAAAAAGLIAPDRDPWAEEERRLARTPDLPNRVAEVPCSTG